MRKAEVVALIFMFLAAMFLAGAKPASGGVVVEDSWTTMAPLPKPYYDVLGAAVVDGKIYFLGENISERYDPGTNSWTAIAPLPIFHMWSTVVACQSKIYVIGHPTQVYDSSTDTWENRTSIPQTFQRRQANVVDDKIYVIGGANFGQGIIDPSDTNYVYDPAVDSWSKMAPVPTPVEGYASTVLGDKIYVIGGGTATNTPIDASNLVQIFDPRINKWTTGTSIPNGVSGAAACSTSGLLAPKRIYVVGGTRTVSGGWLSMDFEAESRTDLNQVYDPETGNWSMAASIPDMRWFSSLVNVNDALYAVGGVNGSDEGITIRSDLSNLDAAKQLMSKTKVQTLEMYTPIGYEGDVYVPDSPDEDNHATSPTEAFPMLQVVSVASTAVVFVLGAGLVAYLRRRKR